MKKLLLAALLLPALCFAQKILVGKASVTPYGLYLVGNLTIEDTSGSLIGGLLQVDKLRIGHGRTIDSASAEGNYFKLYSGGLTFYLKNDTTTIGTGPSSSIDTNAVLMKWRDGLFQPKGIYLNNTDLLMIQGELEAIGWNIDNKVDSLRQQIDTKYGEGADIFASQVYVAPYAHEGLNYSSLVNTDRAGAYTTTGDSPVFEYDFNIGTYLFGNGAITADETGNVFVKSVVSASGGNSNLWNSASFNALYWDGSSTYLNKANARNSLGLGTMAMADSNYVKAQRYAWDGSSLVGLQSTARQSLGLATSSSVVFYALDATILSSGGVSADYWTMGYNDRMKWDGGATGLVAATGRTSLGLKSMALVDSAIFKANLATTYQPIGSYVTGTPWTAMGYVTGTPWTSMGYVTGTPWTGLGYITASALTGYALKSDTSGFVMPWETTPWNTAYSWGNHALAGYVTGTPWTGMGYLTASTGVSQIVAGTNVTISPPNGKGVVTINAAGGSGGSADSSIFTTLYRTTQIISDSMKLRAISVSQVTANHLVKSINDSTYGSGPIVRGSSSDSVAVKADLPTFYVLTDTVSNTSTTLANVTPWAINVVAGWKYRIQVTAQYRTFITTTGIKLGVYMSSGAGTIVGYLRGALSASAVATGLEVPIYTCAASNATGSTLLTTGVSVINTPHQLYGDMIFTCTSSGTLQFQSASEVASTGGSVLYKGSTVIVTPIL